MTDDLRSVIGANLLGREAECAFLCARLETATAGRGGAVAVAGEAGIGKSRLLEEAAAQARQRRVPFLRGASPAGAAAEYAAFDDILRALLAQGTLAEVRALRGAVEELTPGLRERLFASSRCASGAAALESTWRQRLFRARLAAILVAVARRHPLVLCLDDAHRADSASLQLLFDLVRRSRGAPLLVLFGYRPEGPLAAGWTAAMRRLRVSGHLEELTLGRLDDAACRALVAACLPAAELDEDLLAGIGRASEGVPALVLRCLEGLVVEGGLGERDGLWSAEPEARIAGAGDLSPDLERRTDGLDLETCLLLSHAAVQGTRFEGALVARTLGWPLLRTLRALGHLARTTHLLRAEARGFRFAHVLLRDLFYQRLAQTERRKVHRRLGRILGDRPGVDDGVLAGHLLRAGDTRRAAPLLLVAARRARLLGDWRQARHRLEQALGAMADAPLDNPLDPAALQALLDLAQAEEVTGDGPAAERHARQVLCAWRPELGPALAGGALLRLASVAQGRGDWEPAARLYEEAAALLEDADDDRGCARICTGLADIDIARGRLAEAAQRHEEAHRRARKAGDGTLLAALRARSGVVLALQGRALEAVLECSAGLRALAGAGDGRELCRAHRDLGAALVAHREWDAALRCVARAEPLARRTGAAAELAASLVLRARAQAGVGAERAAESACGAARLRMGRLRDRRGLAACDMVAGIVARERACREGLAELYATAAQLLQHSRCVHEDLGCAYAVAECDVELGLTLRYAGDAAGARRHWQSAAETFGEIGAHFQERRVEGMLDTLAA